MSTVEDTSLGQADSTQFRSHGIKGDA